MQSMISIPSMTLDRWNVRTSFLYNDEPSHDCTYVQKWRNFLFWVWNLRRVYVEYMAK